MNFPERYRAQIISAVESIDLSKVTEVIELFRETRASGRSIFVLGNGCSGAAASRFLCDMVTHSSFNRLNRFRILSFPDQAPRLAYRNEDYSPERVLIEHLKNFAEPGDLVVGISAASNSPVIRALGYANWIGCRTVVLCSGSCGVGNVADINLLVGAAHAHSVEDAHSIICHMIGSYFLDFDPPD